MSARNWTAAFVVLTLSAILGTHADCVAGPLTIVGNSDVIAGRNAFVGAGTTTTQFDWSSLFAANAHTTGQLPPNFSTNSVSVTLPDSTVNSVVGANSHSAALNIGNWIDAAGFNGPGNAAAADLAINGVESFDLVFGKDHRSVGLAIITGTGNLANETDLTGATFTFTARDAANNMVGSGIFSLASGKVDQAWLTITSDTAFRKLEVREIGAVSIADQYFSNILTSAQAVQPIPEPSSAVLCLMGTLSGILMYRRKKQVST